MPHPIGPDPSIRPLPPCTRVPSLRRLALRLVAGIACAFAPPLSSAATAPCPAPQHFVDLPAQPMQRSLLALGLEFGAVLSFAPNLVENREAPAVRGCHTAISSLEVMLKDSGLLADAERADVIAIRMRPATAPALAVEPPKPPPATPAVLLDRVLVEGSSAPSAREGLAPQSAQSGTRTETAMLDLAQSVFVLTRDALALDGNPTVAQALGRVIGTDAPSNQFGSLFVDAPLDVRGLPAQMQLSGLRTLRQPGTVESYLLERVEVARGPNGAVGGLASTDGRGGVINAELKRPGGGRVAEIETGVNSRNGGTTFGAFDLASAGKQGLSWRTTGYARGSGATDGGYEPEWARGAAGSLRLREGRLDATLTLVGEQRRSAPPAATFATLPNADADPATTIATLMPGRLTPASRADGLFLKARLFDLDLRWRLSPDWRTSFLLRSESTRSTTVQHMRTRTANFDMSFEEQRARTRLESMQWNLGGNAATGPVEHRLLFAIDKDRWRTDVFSSRGGWAYPRDQPFVAGVTPLDAAYLEGVFAEELPDSARTRHWGVLVQDQASWGPFEARLALRRGQYRQAARYGEVEFATDQVPMLTTSDIGLSYRLSPSGSIYAGTQRTYASSHLALEEDEEDEARGIVVQVRRRIVPQLRQYQLGTKWALHEERALLTAELYRIEVLDLLLQFDQQTGVPGRSTDGLEIEYVGRVSSSLEASVGLGFARSRDTVHDLFGLTPTYRNESTGVPQRSLRMLANYRLPSHWLERTSLGLGMLAMSHRWVVPRESVNSPLARMPVRLPGMATFDLSIKREFDNWTLTGAVLNLTGRRTYGAYGSPDFVPLGPSRGYSLGARVHF